MKKLLAVPVPLLAMAAFAVAPSAALAVPHVYQNGNRLAEGEPFSTIEWGTVGLSDVEIGREVECRYVVGGYAENPEGGGAAIGKVEAFDPYDCVAEGCASLGGEIKVTVSGLPWSVEVIEESGPVFRDKTTGIEVTIDCTGESSALFKGEWKPKAINGSAIGSKPSTDEFGSGSGELEGSEDGEPVGKLKASGKVNVLGYSKEQLVAVKSP